MVAPAPGSTPMKKPCTDCRPITGIIDLPSGDYGALNIRDRRMPGKTVIRSQNCNLGAVFTSIERLARALGDLRALVRAAMALAEKAAHQVFLEPEGLDDHTVYPNGISTSLPFDAQLEFVRSIEGFENAHITRPGYAIEYDFFDPRDLQYSLQTKAVAGLFFAGQINGTTGYEEAGAQGLLAGINAARLVQGKPSWDRCAGG